LCPVRPTAPTADLNALKFCGDFPYEAHSPPRVSAALTQWPLRAIAAGAEDPQTSASKDLSAYAGSGNTYYTYKLRIPVMPGQRSGPSRATIPDHAGPV
jgi:hypothetical protein